MSTAPTTYGAAAGRWASAPEPRAWYTDRRAPAPAPGRGDRLTRAERIALLTLRLSSRPGVVWPLRELAAGTGAARSTVSTDLVAIRGALETAGAGRLETASGPGGGVRYLPLLPPARLRQTVRALAATLAQPDRALPGGFLFMTDVMFSPHWSQRIGDCFATAFAATKPDAVVTVETRGVPLALMTAHALGRPLVLLRRDARVTEGPAVSINYLSGSSQRIQSMSVARRSLRRGARVLIVDDFMKGGGTARGMVELCAEVGAYAVGIGVVVATAAPATKKVSEYRPLLVLEQPVEDGRPMRLRLAPWVARAAGPAPAEQGSRGAR